MVALKSTELKAPEIRPSSMPRAAPSREKEMTENHRRQLKAPSGSSRSFNLKMLTGFLTPPAIVKDWIQGWRSGKRGMSEKRREGNGERTRT